MTKGDNIKIINKRLLQVSASWILTIISYTGFNYALALAKGTLSASAGMNFLGALLRLLDLHDPNKRSKPNIPIGIWGGVCAAFIAAPLWIAYQFFGSSSIILTVVYDVMLIVVCVIGPLLGIIPKFSKIGLAIAGGIACLAVCRILYHTSDIHWSLWLFVLVFLTTAGYIGFNIAVKSSQGSITTQLVMNIVAGVILLVFSNGIWLSTRMLHMRCPVSCNAWSFPFMTNMGIILGGIAIYGIVRFLSLLYTGLNFEHFVPVNVNLSGYTMPLVYEGLVAIGSPLLSLLFHRIVLPIDIIISLCMLSLVGIHLWYHLHVHRNAANNVLQQE